MGHSAMQENGDGACAAPIANMAIVCSELGKNYAIYEHPYDRFLEWLFPHNVKRRQLFKALDNVSLTIAPGQSVGIIGRNGSGKSTFLQLIAGVLQPSYGSVRTNGRIATILELGSGFNSEFSGIDNCRLGASLLGLDPETIEARLPVIARFADIGPFFERPVKLYSSGMQARLAFALICHVDADILIVDEALAVGDSAFSQQCLRFMRAFRERGTLCFVSHDTASILALCDTALWLDHGVVQAVGPARMICRAYQEALNTERRGGYTAASQVHAVIDTALDEPACQCVATVGDFDPQSPWHGYLGAKIVSVEIGLVDAPDCRTFYQGDRVRLAVTATSEQEIISPIIGFSWKDSRGQEIFGSNTLAALSDSEILLAGDQMYVEFLFALPILCSGVYTITVAISEGDQFDHIYHHWIDEVFTVTIETKPAITGLMSIPCHRKIRPGL